MFVQRVVAPSSRRESWTVVGTDGVPVEPIERYLAYLTDVERSPNTVKAYAHDLKDWFLFLALRGLGWRDVRLEDVGEFVAWLRCRRRAGTGGWWCCRWFRDIAADATVNRKLSAVSAFYQHQPGTGLTWGICSGRGSQRGAAAPRGGHSCITSARANPKRGRLFG